MTRPLATPPAVVFPFPECLVRSVPRLTLLGAAAVLLMCGAAAQAQVIHGVVRSQTSARALERARVTAADEHGRALGEATSDDRGQFTLRFDARGAPITLTVRRIGLEPTSTPPFTLAPSDTVEYELAIPERPVVGDTVRVTGMASYNEAKYQEALRRGWKIFPPAEVEKHRDRAQSVYDLLRWAGVGSLVIPTRPTDCVRSQRYMSGERRTDRCMVWVVDGQVLGTTPVLNPSDTYFMAILTASESAIQFGDKAPWGAIVIYTRMNGDRTRP